MNGVATEVREQAAQATPSRLSLAWSALTARNSLSLREVAIAWLGLAVLCALAYAPHVRHGGFYLDDWSNGAATLDTQGGTGFGNVVSFFASIGIYRPVLVLYVPLTYWVFGMHMAYHLAWAAALALLAAGIFFGVMRTLGVPRIHAWIISALTLVYPWFDSTRLWATGDQLTLSIALALGGLWVALVGLSRRSWRWHACAALLYLLSILTYEVTLPLIATVGAIYTARAGWREARLRWAMDLGVVVAGGLWVGTHTLRTKSGISGDIAHFRQIVTGGETILGRTLLPVGQQATTLALVAFFAVLAAGLIAYLLGSDRFSERSGWGLREWLLLTGGGLLVAALGWTMFIPADPYYTPSIYGLTNRVNGLAGFGLAMAVYGSFGVVGALAGRLLPRMRVVAVAVPLILAAVLGLGYVHVLRRHIQIWNEAYTSERLGLDRIRARFPDPQPGTTLLVSGYPANQTLGVPVFSTTWDLNGMVQLTYGDGSLAAYPVTEGSRLACHPGGIQLEGEGSTKVTGVVPYGQVGLFDVATNLRAEPRDLRECRGVIGRYVPGPLYLSTAY